MLEPLISVILPVYKTEQYLDECISSVVNQTYKNLEIILIDDGSPDRCPEMCDVWAQKDARIRVIHKKNGGAAAARNSGLEVAQGKYIGFVDSDDYIRADMFEILLKAINRTDMKVAHCGFTLKALSKESKNNREDISITVLNTEETLRGIFYGKLGTAVWRRLFDRSVFKHVRFPEGYINEEYPMLIPLTMASNGTAVVDEELYYYRSVADSVTATSWKTGDRIVLNNLKIMKNQLDALEIDCEEPFKFFAMRNIINIALSLDKKLECINMQAKENFSHCLKIMREQYWWAVGQDEFNTKDKILYTLVIMRLRRPLYKLIGKW